MATQYQECLTLTQELSSEINDFSDELDDLRSRVSDVSFFGFDGLELKFEIEELQEKVQDLKRRVNSVKEDIQEIARNSPFSESQAEEIKSLWDRMTGKARGFSSTLSETRDRLNNSNLWATIISTIDQIIGSVKELARNLSQIAIKTTVRLLKKGKELLLRGLDDDDD